MLLVLPAAGALPLAGGIVAAVAVLCGAPLLGAVAVRWRPTPLWVGAVCILAAAHAALLTGPGGATLTVVSGVGTAAGLLGLVLLAATGACPRGLRLGVLIGLAGVVLLRTATAGLGLVWSDTAGVRTLTALLIVGLVAVAGSLRPTPAEDRAAAPRAWVWAWLVPAVVLTATLTGATGRFAVATGWTPAQVAATTATAQVLAVLAALVAPRIAATRLGLLAAAALLAGTTASLPAAGWPGVLGPIAVAVGLGALAGIELPSDRDVPLHRRGWAPGAALALAGGVLLLYELAAHLGLPGNTRPLLLLAVALGAALLAVAAGRPVHSTTVRAQLRPVPATSALLAAGLLVAAVTLLAPPTQGPPPGTDPVADRFTVASFEVGAGFGTDLRYDPRRQAGVLWEAEVDLVLLNGVDRGGWLAGGQDLLPLLQAHLGLEYVLFAPAGTELAGHALLSRHPITEFASEPLPGGSRSAVHSQLAAVVTLPGDQQLGVIGTQLAVAEADDEARLPQARAVAGNVARLRERQLPTVLLGDLGGPLDGAILESFTPLLPGTMPDGAHSYPAAAPTELRDHVLLSPELRRVGLAIPSSGASTHLPVVVTVQGLDDAS